MLINGEAKNITDLAAKLGLKPPYVTRVLGLNNLAPDIVEAIVSGAEPDGLSIAQIMKNIPEDWNEQRRLFGFPERWLREPLGGRRNLAAFLRFKGRVAAVVGKGRVSGKGQHKSPCEAVLWKKLHRIFVRLEKMPAIFFASPITSVRIDDFWG